jgi:5-methylcytosine-specific restriction endonuclease McrA
MAWAGRYAEYLETAHWADRRDRKIAASGGQCDRCGFYGQRDQDGRLHGLDVHHLTYETLGHEDMSDLETLCRTCHREQHGIPGATREQERAKVTNRINARLGLDFEPDDEDLVALGLARDDITVEVEAWDSLADQAGLR